MTDMRLSASIVLKLAEKGVPGEVYNVGTGSAVSMKDLLSEIISQARVNISLQEKTNRMRIYDKQVLIANVSKLEALTHVQPIFHFKDIIGVILSDWRRKIRLLYSSTLLPPPSNLGAIFTIYSERKKVLLKSISTWNRYLPWAKNKYPVIIFIAAGQVTDVEKQLLRVAAGELEVRFVIFNYGWNQKHDRAGNGGGPWINWLLSKEMYDLPEIRNFEYIIRMDKDVFFYNISNLDIFQDMKNNGILVGWKQWIFDNEVALGSGLSERAFEYNANWSKSRGYHLSDVWRKVTDPESSHHRQPFLANFQRARISRWRPYLVAGCVEMYSNSIFRTPHYRQWLNDLRIEDGLSKSLFWEQEVKTLWMQTYVHLAKWKSYACNLPIYHKVPDTISSWFFHDCDYTNGRVLSTSRCDIDSQLRIC